MPEESIRPRKQKKQRIWEIDFLRGFAVLLMIIDHFLWDAKYLTSIFANFDQVANPFISGLHSFAFSYWFHPARYATHLVFSGLFFILSGVSCALSKNNFLHAAKILIAAAVLDLATFVVFWITKANGVAMIFTVLLPLGVGVLLVALINLIPLPKLARGLLFIGLGVAIFITCLCLDLYWVSDNGSDTMTFEWEHFWDYVMGFKMWGSDFFPIVPYIAYTFFGAGIGILLYEDKKQSLLPKLDGIWNKPICFLGKNTLWVYLIHQVILWLVLGGLCLILGYRLAI